VYTVQASVADVGRFKTDFANPLMRTTKYILENSVLRRANHRVITATRYRHHPEALFEWETTVQADRRRMRYRLLNPRQCGQIFQFGQIRLKPLGNATEVVHTAYSTMPAFSGGIIGLSRVECKTTCTIPWNGNERPCNAGRRSAGDPHQATPPR